MDTNEVKGPIARKPKPYQAPVLTVYGDAKLLTKAVGGASANKDGGMGKNQNKTA